MKISFILITLLFMASNHPFSMIFFLVMMSISISMITFYTMMTSWFSYIFLLVILSGMMMIFLYMATLSPNEHFTITPIFIILFPFMPMISHNPTSPSIPQLWTIKQNLSSFSLFTILMAVFLFITMTAVTKISSLEEGPLFSF